MLTAVGEKVLEVALLLLGLALPLVRAALPLLAPMGVFLAD
jgi:hypothetical protein